MIEGLKRNHGFEEEPQSSEAQMAELEYSFLRQMDTDAHGWIIPLEQHPGYSAKGSNQSMPLYQSVFIRVHRWFEFLLLNQSLSVGPWVVFHFPQFSLNSQLSTRGNKPAVNGFG